MDQEQGVEARGSQGARVEVMLPNACPKPKPRIFEKRDERRDAEALKRQVYAEVDARDQRRCQCCGRRGNPNAVEALGRIHRHHILEASRGGPMTAANILSVCALCHSLIHAKQLWVIGKDANRGVRFEIHEAAVVEVFGNRVLPKHVRIVL